MSSCQNHGFSSLILILFKKCFAEVFRGFGGLGDGVSGSAAVQL